MYKFGGRQKRKPTVRPTQGKKRKDFINPFADFLDKKEKDEIGDFSSSESDDEEKNIQHSNEWRSNVLSQNICHFRDLCGTEDGEEEEKISMTDDDNDNDDEFHNTDEDDTSELDIDESFDETQTKVSRPNDMTIKEYGSDEEELEEEKSGMKRETKLNVKEDHTPMHSQSIETQSSVENQTPLKSTPTKEEEESQCSINEEDSEQKSPVKRKSKVLRGGLMERIQKLQRRQQSDIAFWKHNTKEHLPRNALQCEVKTIKSEYAINSVVCSVQDEVEFTIIIPDHLFKDYKISIHSKLHVYQPWRRLYIKESKTILLLCAHHIIVCPSNTNLSLTRQNQEMVEFFKQQQNSIEKFNNDDDNMSDNDVDEIETDPPMELSTIDVANHLSFTIQGAIEGSGFSKPMIIVGRIQRILLSKFKETRFSQDTSPPPDDDNANRLSVKMLVQDAAYMLGEVHFNVDSNDEKIIKLLSTAEGEAMEMSNLNFIKTTSCRRNASLKSLMQSLSIQCEESQNSETSQTDTQSSIGNHKQICIFSMDDCDTISASFKRLNSSFDVSYQPPMTEVSPSSPRLSMDVRLLTISNNKTNSTHQEAPLTGCYCCIYAANISGNIIKIQVHQCYIPENVINAFGDPPDGVTLHLKDIRQTENDAFLLDGFSRIFLLTHKTPTNNLEELFVKKSCSGLLLRNSKVNIPELKENSQIGDLLRLTGRICGIDEKTAFISRTCHLCGSMNISDNKGNYYCQDCLKNTECKARLHLDVYLFLSSLPSLRILCKLRDETLSTLLSKQNILKNGLTSQLLKSIMGKKLIGKLFVVVGLDEKHGRHKTKMFYLRECKSYVG